MKLNVEQKFLHGVESILEPMVINNDFVSASYISDFLSIPEKLVWEVLFKLSLDKDPKIVPTLTFYCPTHKESVVHKQIGFSNKEVLLLSMDIRREYFCEQCNQNVFPNEENIYINFLFTEEYKNYIRSQQ